MSNKLEQALFGAPVVQEKESIKDGKLVAFYESQEIDSKLILLSIGMGLNNKSLLLRMIVKQWLETHDPVITLSGKIAQILESPDGKKMDKKEFKGKLSHFLKDRKVSKDLIDQVLKTV